MIDEYGNEIEYDVNNWVGEDNSANSINSTTKGTNALMTSTYGTLHIKLDDSIMSSINDSILVSIINDKYETKDLYLYSTNNYEDDFKLQVGKYNIILVMNMGTDTEINTTLKSFNITENETSDLVLDKKVEQIETTETFTTAIETYDNINTDSYTSLKSFLLIVIIFAIISIITLFIIIKVFKNRES